MKSVTALIVGLAWVVVISPQLRAADPTDGDRLQKLEDAVQLQQRNAELEKRCNSSRRNANHLQSPIRRQSI